jgi:hypothetical protein
MGGAGNRPSAAAGQQADAQKNQVERNADVIAWSLWRRAHQAAAQKSHLKQKSQL